MDYGEQNEPSNQISFTEWLNGEVRTDGWISPWRAEQERRRKEDMGDRKFVAAPQVAAKQERRPIVRPTPKPAPRTCEMCPKVIQARNKTGRCVNHLPRRVPSPPVAKSLCPSCDKPLRRCNVVGVCSRCYARYRHLINQVSLRVCDECMTQIRTKNNTGKCTIHAKIARRDQENASQRDKRRATRALKLAA